jgi:hypothetical protein
MDFHDETLGPEGAWLRAGTASMTARRITSAELARLRRQPDPPFVLGILGYWRITTADRFKQDPDKTRCWTGSMAELLEVLQPEIRRRPKLTYYLKGRSGRGSAGAGRKWLRDR